jgi:hypothetical protein
VRPISFRSVSAVQPPEDGSDALHPILNRYQPLNNKNDAR